MLNLLLCRVIATAVLAATALAASPALSEPPDDPSRCGNQVRSPAALILIDGLANQSGKLRIYVYGNDPRTFLKKAGRVKKVNLPAARLDPSRQVCVTLPAPGRYAIVVQHDVDADKKMGLNDGAGASRNPPASRTHLRPSFDQVVITIGDSAVLVPITVRYFRDLH